MLKDPGDFPIYFARHGETLYNVEDRYQGNRNDSALTPRGREQARDLGLILGDFIDVKRPPRFVASPLKRARTTMEIALETLELPRDAYATDERLVEIDLGEWSGRYVREIETDDHGRWAVRDTDKWTIPAPGGESYSDVAARATAWFSSLREETVAVGHGAFGRILRGLYLGLSWQEMSSMNEPHGVVYRLQAGSISTIEL